MGEKKERKREREKREKEKEMRRIISLVTFVTPFAYIVYRYSIYIVQVQRTLNERVDNILRGTHEPRPMAH